MVREEMYKEIQSYKQKGYSIRGCGRELSLDRKTVKRYWEMTAEDYVHYLADCKRRTRILDPYREEIAVELQTHPSITSAIIYDHLKERHGLFKPSYGSVRLYVRVMREELGIPSPRKIRQYMEVEEKPAGHQAQVDMGQMIMSDPYGKRIKIYIFAMVMSLSRKKYVYFQDHPFNGAEFIEAHDRAFKY